jgi:molybdate-binding protein
MSAVADLKVRTADNAVAVPVSAIVRDGSTDAVWVVKNGLVERRTVRLGAEGEANVQVVEGVQPGDTVVVKGADRVREGQQLE